jgi:UDP-glucose 4-epimerase
VLQSIAFELPAGNRVNSRNLGISHLEELELRIIVTGGAGFIGSHIVDEFINAGHEVMVLDNLWQHGGGRRANLPVGVEFAQLDILSESIAPLFRRFRPEIVCHHAGQHSVSIGNRDPGFDAEVNVLGLIRLLEASVENKVQKFLFASSAATFGNPEQLPITETTPQCPTSPYGITKMVSEHYLRFFRAEHGLDFTALRYANVYGPRQSPDGEAGVIAIFVARFLQQLPVRLDSDGQQTRDYIYVGDVARANVQALTRGSSDFFLVGTGVRTSVNDIYRALVEVTGYQAPIVHAPRRAGDVLHSHYNILHAKRELDWRPEVQLLEGMQRTVDFFRRATLSLPSSQP